MYKVKEFDSKQLEAFRYLAYTLWNYAGAMQHHKAAIEQMGVYPSAVKAHNEVLEGIKSTWLAIEATGIMPKLFSESAAQSLNITNLSSIKKLEDL